MTSHDRQPDRFRGAVYQAEDTIASVMARPHRAVRLEREVITLPAEARFGSLPAIQSFVDAVLADPRTAAAYPGCGPVVVQAKRGFRSATYSDGVIHIPAADPRGRWALTRAVALHEIAHHLAGRPGHGREFRAALIHLYALHLGPGAAALLGHLFAPLDSLPDPTEGPVDPEDPANVPVRRVAALLAKAQSTQSTEEAEAYLAKAALVAQRHSIDLAVAAMTDDQRSSGPTHRMLTIGEPRRALNRILVSLYVEIARAWSVKVDIGHGSTYVLGYGMPADLDQVESVFATASTLMVGRSQEHMRSGVWKGTTYRSPGSSMPRPVTAAVARNAFCLGFVARLGQRIRLAAEEARRGAEGQVVAGRTSASAGAHGRDGRGRIEVALRARELAVSDYHRSASKARGSWRGSASSAGSAATSRLAGERAAEEYGRRGITGARRALGT